MQPDRNYTETDSNHITQLLNIWAQSRQKYLYGQNHLDTKYVRAHSKIHLIILKYTLFNSIIFL